MGVRYSGEQRRGEASTLDGDDMVPNRNNDKQQKTNTTKNKPLQRRNYRPY